MARSTMPASFCGGVGSTKAARMSGAEEIGNGPAVELMDVSENTRCGCSIARRCPIIPPKDMPTMGGWKSASMVTRYAGGVRARSTTSTGSAGLLFGLELHV